MSLLQVQDISMKFLGLTAIDHLSFTVEKGQIHGLIGPNGAGKTTVFNCITGIYTPQGKIFYNGQEIQGKAPHQIARLGILRTFQTIRLFAQMSVAENVMSGRHIKSTQRWYNGILPTPNFYRDEEEQWAKTAEYIKLFGLADYRFTPAGDLPYGIQRKIEMARALAAEPELLILDEPAAGLNESESRELSQTIREIQKRGVSILMIEHDMDMVMELCDYITAINFGAKISEGTPQHVQNDNAVIEAYIGSDND